MLLYLLIRWAIMAISIGVTAWLMPGLTVNGGLLSLFVIALIFGLVNAIVKPIIALLTCPLVLLTLGLFLLVINAGMLLLTAWFTPYLTVNGFWPAFWASIIISIISAVLSMFVTES